MHPGLHDKQLGGGHVKRTADGDDDAKAAAVGKFNDAISTKISAPVITAIGDDTLSTDYSTSTSNAVITIPNAKIPENKDAAVYTVIFAITINWGSDFGNVNPYVYFNAQPHNNDLADDAEKALNDLYEAINGIKYNVTIAEKAA